MAYEAVQACSEAAVSTLIPQLALPLLIYVVLAIARGYSVQHKNASNDPLESALEKVSGGEDAPEHLPLVSSLSSRSQDSRYEWMDAYRFWLVAAVIVGHSVSWPLTYFPLSKYYLSPLILWLEVFSMPGLAFISGLCARGPLTWGRIQRLFTRVFVPFLFFRFVKFAGYTSATCQGAGYTIPGATKYLTCLSDYPRWVSLSAASDGDIEWYLFSLVQWRLAATCLTWLWPEALLTLSFGIGILSGYFDVMSFLYVLDIPGMPIVLSVPHRTMSFLPFFAAGLLVDPTACQNALRRRPHIQRLARALLVGTFGISIFVVCSGIGVDFFKMGAVGDFNYDYITVRTNWERPWELLYPPLCGPAYNAAGLYRAIRYALSFTMLVLVWAAALPSAAGLVEAGRHTMYPYLLHQWPLILLDPFLFSHPLVKLWTLGYTGKAGWLVWAAGVPLALGFTYVSTWSWVRRIFGPFIEPDWILWCWKAQPKGTSKGLIR